MMNLQRPGAARTAVVQVAALAAGLLLAWALPAPEFAGLAGYVPLHTLLETLSIVIAALVFAVGWHAHSRELPGNTVLLACAFVGVGLLDFSHTLSFAGMPDFVTPSGPEKAINFWLAARLLAALALLTAALRPWRPMARAWARYGLLAAVLVATAAAHWVFLFHPERVPRSFVPGVGLTAFKIGAEWALIALNLGAAAALWPRLRGPQPFDAGALFVAVCAMAFSEVFFTLYANVSDIYNLMGHLYKVIAYLAVYRAIFVHTVERPYRRLREAEARLRATFATIPDLIWVKDREGAYLDCNPAFERAVNLTRAQILGATDEQVMPEGFGARLRRRDLAAMAQDEPVTNQQWLTFPGSGYQGLFETVRAPMRDAQGQVTGVLGVTRDISATHRTLEALRASEERVRLAVQVARIGIFEHDHATGAIHWSAEQREHYGFPPDETVRMEAIVRQIEPADYARLRPAIDRALDPAGDGTLECEYRIHRRDGSLRYLSMRAMAQFAGEGSNRHAVRLIGAVLDITERVLNEEGLRASEENLAVTLQSIGDAVIATDLEGRVTRMNTVAGRLTGWPPASALGRPLGEVFRIVDGQSRQALASPVQRVLAQGEIVGLSGHTVLLAQDGQEYHIADSAAPIRDASGRVMGVVLVFSDVTEQYLAQQALQAHAEALRLRDRALTQISQGVVITDERSIIRYVNPGFERLTGYDADEALGRHPEFLLGPDIPAETRAEIERAIAAGREFQCELPHRHRDGSAYWVGLDLSPIRDGSGALTGYVIAQRDISERKQAEAERRSLENQLRESQKMESIGTLAGGIAHDFNNLLGAILGNVALARSDLPWEHPALLSLQQIQKAASRARDLVQQILTFSRRSPQALVCQPLQPLVHEAISLLRATLPARVSLEMRLAETPLYLNADGTQIEQIVMNLCTNAWHAMHDSTGRIVVGLEEQVLDAAAAAALGALPPGHYAHLWIQDSGTGMDEATRERIFEPFFTTKGPGQGTGLGLAVVHGIVAAHQGAIAVDSAPGQGSTFHLYFPAVPAPEGGAAPLPVPAQQGHGEHVLYVDDDEVMLLMVERLLQRAGYRATCCRSPQEALALVRAAPQAVDAVVTDFNMPGTSGLELAQALVALRPELPVVISSGFITDELREGARRLGVRHLLQKQHTVEDLVPIVHGIIGA